MWMFNDWLWSMYAPRSAAMSITCFCLISHVVLYNSFKSSGIVAIACTLPLWRRISSFISEDQSPLSIRSLTRCLFRTMNSPERVLLTYKLEVNASKHSLFPRIWLVEAVGIGATIRELRMPCSTICSLRLSQSQRPECSVIPHRSGCSNPLLAGEPSKEE